MTAIPPLVTGPSLSDQLRALDQVDHDRQQAQMVPVAKPAKRPDAEEALVFTRVPICTRLWGKPKGLAERTQVATWAGHPWVIGLSWHHGLQKGWKKSLKEQRGVLPRTIWGLRLDEEYCSTTIGLLERGADVPRKATSVASFLAAHALFSITEAEDSDEVNEVNWFLVEPLGDGQWWVMMVYRGKPVEDTVGDRAAVVQLCRRFLEVDPDFLGMSSDAGVRTELTPLAARMAPGSLAKMLRTHAHRLPDRAARIRRL